MALSGNFTRVTYLPSSETSSVNITYPAELPESDPNYDKRGTTELTTGYATVKSTTDYSNIYLAVRSIVVNATDVNTDPDTMGKLIKYETNYRVYESEATRRADQNDYLFQDFTHDITYNASQDLFDQAYTHLKSLEGFENLIDA